MSEKPYKEFYKDLYALQDFLKKNANTTEVLSFLRVEFPIVLRGRN